jgi:hypothetical protein
MLVKFFNQYSNTTISTIYNLFGVAVFAWVLVAMVSLSLLGLK